MRLMNTTSKVLKEFMGTIPRYAILSHVWGEEEVLFKDLDHPQKVRQMKGYSKITAACAQAVQDGLEYIWIDTCCINKESSAELSEAINSMYAWYRDSHVCYAYLVDVRSDEDPESLDSSFSTSKWFTRGWTLQELLAPLRVEFFGGDWVNIGTKSMLKDTISIITGISIEGLLPKERIRLDFMGLKEDIPIAVRMSWAAGRETTREEDIAYCLMGIFDVNMPLLYGEGKKAFIRLQHEIIKNSDDHSIFAWRDMSAADVVWETFMESNESDVDDGLPTVRGILAQSPAYFKHSNKVERYAPTEDTAYSMTNKGLHIELPLVPCDNLPTIFVAVLGCQVANEPVTIVLIKGLGDQYARFAPSTFGEGVLINPDADTKFTPIFAAEHIPDFSIASADTHISAVVRESAGYQAQYVTSRVNNSESGSSWKHIPSTTAWSVTGPPTPRVGTLVFKGVYNTDVCAITCGFRGHTLWVEVVTDFEKESVEGVLSSYDLPPGVTDRDLGYSQYLDRCSAVLPSGWSVVASSLRTHPAPSGNPPVWHYEINIEFERRTSRFEGHKWVNAYQVNVAVDAGYRVVTEDLSDVKYYGKWLKQKEAFICQPSYDRNTYILPFKRIDGDARTDFFLVIDRPPKRSRHGLRTAIVTSRPDSPQEVLKSEGRVENSYNVPLESYYGTISIDVTRNVAMGSGWIIDVKVNSSVHSRSDTNFSTIPISAEGEPLTFYAPVRRLGYR